MQLRTLIVDDNAVNRMILERQLASWNIPVDTADSGRSALDKLRRESERGTPYELILIDGHMPEMDGFALAEYIRGDHQLTGVSIMLLSSDNLYADAARCHQLGIKRYLVKPVASDDLKSAIGSVLTLGQRSAPRQATRASVSMARHPLQQACAFCSPKTTSSIRKLPPPFCGSAAMLLPWPPTAARRSNCVKPRISMSS